MKSWYIYPILVPGVSETVLRLLPAEFHSQTAVECAMTIHGQLQKMGKSADDIKKITIRTHEACIRIID